MADCIFPIFLDAEKHAVIVARPGVFVAIIDDLQNAFLIGVAVQLSVNLRQLHAAFELFKLRRGVFRGTDDAFIQLIAFLLNERLARRRFKVIVQQFRYAEVVAALFENFINTFLEARQF